MELRVVQQMCWGVTMDKFIAQQTINERTIYILQYYIVIGTMLPW